MCHTQHTVNWIKNAAAIQFTLPNEPKYPCLLYTSDAADDMQCVDLGGRRIIKKRKNLVVADA